MGSNGKGDGKGGARYVPRIIPRRPARPTSSGASQGVPNAEIPADYPDVGSEDIGEALRYAAAAIDERELPLRQPA